MADANRKGYVYLIVNDQIRGRIKIGYTMREPIDRALGLRSTGTTGTFVVVYQALVINPRDIETEVHRRFAAHNVGLEWFAVCPNLAKEAIVACAGKVLFEDTCPRWHPSQPEPEDWTKTLLHEAKIAAEKEAVRREQAERAARLEAERRQAEEARLAESARRAAETAERQRLAQERAKAAALQAEAEQRKRQQEIEAAKRRQEREKFGAVVAAMAAFGGLAFWIASWAGGSKSPNASRANAPTTQQAPVARVLKEPATPVLKEPVKPVLKEPVKPVLKGPVTPVVVRSRPDPEVARCQLLVEQAEQRVGSLRAAVAAKQQEVTRLEGDLSRLSYSHQQELNDIQHAQAAIESASRRLIAKQERLRRLAMEEPRDLARSGELYRGEADLKKLQSEVEVARATFAQASRDAEGLPDRVRSARERIREAEAGVSAAERRLAEQVQSLEAARRELAEAVRRSQR